MVEAVVAGALFLMVGGVLIYVFVHSRKVQETVNLYTTLLQNVTIALHAIRSDLNHIAIVSNEPLIPCALDKYSFKTYNSDRAILMRISSPVPIDPKVVGSYFTFVAYRLVPTEYRQDRFYLSRVEFTSSQKNLPGKNVNREEKIFKTFILRGNNTSFLYVPPDPAKPDTKDLHVLHVALDVVSDTGPTPIEGAFSEKGMIITSVVRLVQPETPFSPYDPSPLAEPIFLSTPPVAPDTQWRLLPMPPTPPVEIRAAPAKILALDPASLGL